VSAGSYVRLGKGTQEKINFSQVFGSLPDRLSA
jgi:hypothetical protein